MEWGRSQTNSIQNIEIVWGAIIPPRTCVPPALCKSTPSPLFNNILLPFGNRPFWGRRYFVKIMKSIFWKTISKPPHNCAYYFSGGSTPTDGSTCVVALVRALRNGMGSFSDLEHSKHRNCLGSNRLSPGSCMPPTLCKSTPLFNHILLPIS